MARPKALSGGPSLEYDGHPQPVADNREDAAAGKERVVDVLRAGPGGAVRPATLGLAVDLKRIDLFRHAFRKIDLAVCVPRLHELHGHLPAERVLVLQLQRAAAHRHLATVRPARVLARTRVVPDSLRAVGEQQLVA